MSTVDISHSIEQKEMRNNMVKFMRNIADSLEQNNLAPFQERVVSEFFMKYKFVNLRSDDKLDDDMMKFLSLGWYVYTQLIPNQ